MYSYKFHLRCGIWLSVGTAIERVIESVADASGIVPRISLISRKAVEGIDTPGYNGSMHTDLELNAAALTYLKPDLTIY